MMKEKSTGSIWNILIKKKSFLDWFKHTKKLQAPLSSQSVIYEKCKGLLLNDLPVKTILFSTDLAIIENTECDAVLAVYPFAPSEKIMRTLIEFCDKPVICGVGGGVTKGKISIEMAVIAQHLGACAVIVNQPFKNNDLKKMRKLISIPIIASISTENFDFKGRLKAGTDIFHITGGKNTPKIVQLLTEYFPDVPLICTAGQSTDSLKKVLDEDVSAVVLTPPSSADLFKNIMSGYRNISHKSVTVFHRIIKFFYLM